jgi:hypothetical protein
VLRRVRLAAMQAVGRVTWDLGLLWIPTDTGLNCVSLFGKLTCIASDTCIVARSLRELRLWGDEMRVISTFMYFDEVNGERKFRRHPGRGEETDPGIGIAWFAGETSDLMPISNLKAFRSVLRDEREFNEQALRNYLDLFLVDADEFEFEQPERSLKNEDIVDFLINEPFVIEKSPPIHVRLKGMIDKTNLPVWIGTYMGWHVVPEHSVMLFITIPGGIVVVSSAIGLSSALAAGLNKSVKKLFKMR